MPFDLMTCVLPGNRSKDSAPGRPKLDLLAFDQLKRVLRQVEATPWQRLDMTRLFYRDPCWPFGAGCAIAWAIRDRWFRERGLADFRDDVPRVFGLEPAAIHFLFLDWPPGTTPAQVIARIDDFLAGAPIPARTAS